MWEGNASFAIEVTDDGIIIEVNDEQCLNEFSPINVTDVGILIMDQYMWLILRDYIVK